MRRRLAVLALATTSLVVISLLVPLALLVKREASDQARLEAERSARSVANLTALAFTVDPDTQSIASSVSPLPDSVVLTLPDGTTLGSPVEGQGVLVARAAERQATLTAVVDGGWEIALPVVGRDGVVVVDAFVTDAELTEGVVQAWLLLAALGVILVSAAVWVADRLGRRLVDPIGDLAKAARRMGQGDLDARVDVGEPEEIRDVGRAFNELAERLELLLVEERESVADLSHGLRTPLTSLRLQAEKVSDTEERAEVLAQVDRLEHSIDGLIVEARSRSTRTSGVSAFDSVVFDRVAFWRVLADEQGRELTVALNAGEIKVDLPEKTLQSVVDVLIGNVFSHTEPGTSLEIRTRVREGLASLEVLDRGKGFGGLMPERGVSSVGSTGLGLDIARKAAESTGGGLQITERNGGGAAVRVLLGSPTPT